MKPSESAACKKITEALARKEVYTQFRMPVNPRTQRLVDYEKIITYPMDLSTVKNKLDNDIYRCTADWYNDMCIIFRNAITYHSPETIIYRNAEYCLQDFVKTYHYMKYRNLEAWYEDLKKLTAKFVKKVANSPVKQGVDPLLDAILKESETKLPPSTQNIPEIIDKLNRLMEKTHLKNDVIRLLKETQPGFFLKGPEAVVDADQLCDRALSALSLFVSAHT